MAILNFDFLHVLNLGGGNAC